MVGDDGGSLGVHRQVLGQSLHGIHVDLQVVAWGEMDQTLAHCRAKSVVRGQSLAALRAVPNVHRPFLHTKAALSL